MNFGHRYRCACAALRYTRWCAAVAFCISGQLLGYSTELSRPSGQCAECPPREPANGDGRSTVRSEQIEQARKAVEELTKELEGAGVSDADTLCSRGDAYLLLEDYERAFADYSNAAKAGYRSKASLAIRRSRAAIGMGDDRTALADARGATYPSPLQATAYAVTAMILAKSEDETVRDPRQP